MENTESKVQKKYKKGGRPLVVKIGAVLLIVAMVVPTILSAVTMIL